MDTNLYSFGSRLAGRFDFYSYPRTGSHYLWTCLTGLTDLVFFPNIYATNPEAMQRAAELDPRTFYMMKLREDGVPYQPVYINPEPQGTHGTPALQEWPLIILIRDPHPTIYSWYFTATERWNLQVSDRVAWIRDAYIKYGEFYDRAMTIKAEAEDQVHLLRFEDLKRDSSTLARLVEFIGVRPKLSPDFVHWATDFERMTKSTGAKTFFRAGHNGRWREDSAWLDDLRKVAPPSLARFGYTESI